MQVEEAAVCLLAREHALDDVRLVVAPFPRPIPLFRVLGLFVRVPRMMVLDAGDLAVKLLERIGRADL